MDLVLFGPPGAGKGTQAKLLVQLLGVPQVATGDMMRSERASGSELGKRFDEFMSVGKLVPDELVLQLIEGTLASETAREGAIFDGYPRTTAQAEALDKLLSNMGRTIDHVVSLQITLDHILDRVVGRRACFNCGQTYHLRYSPPPSSGVCSVCGSSQIKQRKDDHEDVVRRRYEAYKSETEPVLSHYEAKGVVVRVDGVGELSEVTSRITAAIGVETDG